MICPRCSLNNPNSTLVCARCGERTPRPVPVAFDSVPGGRPRFSPALAREIPLDRRGRGVRALDTFAPTIRVRAPAPQWVRSRARDSGPYLHTPRMYQVPLVAPAAAAAAAAPALPSEVRSARTSPEWLVAPLDESAPEAFAGPAEAASAPHLRRLGAWLVDTTLVLALTGLAWGAAALALGPARVLPLLDRGFDYLLDGLVVDRGLGLVALGLALVLGFALSTLSHALLGATPGKRLAGLLVVTRDGGRPTPGICAGRSIAAGLSLLPAGLGIVWALFDPDRRTLHDRLLGTRVVAAPVDIEMPPDVESDPTAPPADPSRSITEVG